MSEWFVTNTHKPTSLHINENEWNQLQTGAWNRIVQCLAVINFCLLWSTYVTEIWG